MDEPDDTPTRGLPGRLPEGETLLWQGGPGAASFARHGLHVGALAAYFGLLLAWCAARLLGGAADDASVVGFVMSMGELTGLALLALGVVALFAWLTARTAVYTITDRRVVLHFGIAFPMTLNLPFSAIEQAGVRRFADGSGDLPLTLSAPTKMGYVVLWPHARPWRLKPAQPMLRAIPEVERVAQLLGRALAAAAAQAATPLPPGLAGPAASGATVHGGQLGGAELGSDVPRATAA